MMLESSGDTQREATALADTLVSQGDQATQQHQEQMVPVHVVQAMRDELRSVKQEAETFKNHIQMMQWQSQQTRPQAPADPFDGLDPEDSIRAKDAKKLVMDLKQHFESQLAEVKMSQKAADYGDMIKKYLPLAAQEDPELMRDIQNSANPYKAAYNAVKASKAYQEDLINERIGSMKQQTPPSPPREVAQKVVTNSKASGSVSSVAGNSAAIGSLPSFSQMTDDEFRQFKSGLKMRKAGAK